MERIEALLRELTLEEKVAMLSGSDAWHSTGVERLGIPSFKMTDGPHGARGDNRSGATAAHFPVGTALGATWDPELIAQVGQAVADEAQSKGAQVLLGPTVNIHRSPLAGRNFECYSEDPYLTSRIATAFIRGVQDRGVAACVKHFVCNDSEFERHSISSEVGERALREIYLPPFEAAVREAGAWSAMSAYNRINGTFASSHRPLLHDLLKGEWGFDGVVISDWGAALETVANANGGLDLEMPGPARTFGSNLLDAVRAGSVDEKTLDDKVRRLLRLLVHTGRLDLEREAPERAVDRPEHRALARRAAADAMVLVKNEGALPLAAGELRRLAVIGPNAREGHTQGGGSSRVNPHYASHPLAALLERLPDVEVVHEPGCDIHRYATAFEPARLEPVRGDGRGFTLEYWNGSEAEGEPALTRVVRRSRAVWMGRFAPEVDPEQFAARYTARFTPGESGAHTFGLLSAGRARLLVDGRAVIDNWTSQDPGDAFFGSGSAERRAAVELEAGRAYEVRVDYQRTPGGGAGIQFGVLSPLPPDPIGRAVEAARGTDAAVLVVGTSAEWESEGGDRKDMELPGAQVELIERVAAANPRTVVVVNAGSPVGMDWLERVPAALVAWFPGQEFGNALADVLLGDVDPGGRLPTTFPRRLEDTPAFTGYPGEAGRVLYGEGVFVGYRWYDARDLEPRLPFGHGLSYTRFEYGALEVAARQRAGARVEARLELRNAGARAGREVVQLYVCPPPGRLARPPQELKAFAKVALEPGERRLVELDLDARALACWDPAAADWVAPPGRYELLAGASSRDIRARAAFTLE